MFALLSQTDVVGVGLFVLQFQTNVVGVLKRAFKFVSPIYVFHNFAVLEVFWFYKNRRFS